MSDLVLPDTTAWSMALRRRRRQLSPSEFAIVSAVERAIVEDTARLLGTVRQEVLSGVPDDFTFYRLRDYLRRFPDEPVHFDDYERAAAFFNRCRSRGIQGSAYDFLVVSVAVRLDATVITTDRDFPRYQQHIPFRLVGL